jgi:hypothetical protein
VAVVALMALAGAGFLALGRGSQAVARTPEAPRQVAVVVAEPSQEHGLAGPGLAANEREAPLGGL